MAYTDIHVSGPAIVSVARAGQSVSRLGVTDEGVNLRLDANYEPVMADDLGPYVPTDHQFMGILASISGRFTRYDESLMEQLRARTPGRGAGLMTAADIGHLAITASLYWIVYIESAARTGSGSGGLATVEPPWRFPMCLPTDAFSLNVGTRFSKSAFGFTAYPNNGVLYTRA